MTRRLNRLKKGIFAQSHDSPRQMLVTAMLIDALHAAFENAEIALNRVSADFAANIFLNLVAHALVALEVIAKRIIAAAFIGCQSRSL